MLLADFIRRAAARLETLYPSPEARGLVLMLCEEKLGVCNYTHIVEPQTRIPEALEDELEQDLRRLSCGEPIQYVLGVAEFCGHRFAVGPGVLVPRPETEQLVAMGVNALRGMDLGRAPRVLDLCTGSGCIAWSVALEIRDAQVVGIDLSEAALRYARGQFPSGQTSFADLIGEPPTFLQADVLDATLDIPGGPFDLILSNPPYVTEREKAQMRPNVLDYEPPMALFVPDGDPLCFYRAIAAHAKHLLRPGGTGMVEINEQLGDETAAVFREAGFKNTQKCIDFREKTRFIRF